MPLKFAANLSFMFQEEQNLSNRYGAAKEAGFKFVEIGFPYDCGESFETLANAKKAAGLEQVLINSYPGNIALSEQLENRGPNIFSVKKGIILVRIL